MLAVKIENLPDRDVDWNDSTPQCPRSSLSFEHFLPSTDDADALHKAATQYIMEVLVEEFDCLHHLKPLVPCRHSPHQVSSPTVAPMAILFKDEKYKAETVEILRELMADAKLSGNPQVHMHGIITIWDNWLNISGGGWRSANMQEHSSNEGVDTN